MSSADLKAIQAMRHKARFQCVLALILIVGAPVILFLMAVSAAALGESFLPQSKSFSEIVMLPFILCGFLGAPIFILRARDFYLRWGYLDSALKCGQLERYSGVLTLEDLDVDSPLVIRGYLRHGDQPQTLEVLPESGLVYRANHQNILAQWIHVQAHELAGGEAALMGVKVPPEEWPDLAEAGDSLTRRHLTPQETEEMKRHLKYYHPWQTLKRSWRGVGLFCWLMAAILGAAMIRREPSHSHAGFIFKLVIVGVFYSRCLYYFVRSYLFYREIQRAIQDPKIYRWEKVGSGHSSEVFEFVGENKMPWANHTRPAPWRLTAVKGY